MEISLKGIDPNGSMNVSFDTMFSAAGQLPPEAQIAHLGKLVGLLQQYLDRAVHNCPAIPAGAAATDSLKGPLKGPNPLKHTMIEQKESLEHAGSKRKQKESLEHAGSEKEQKESLEPRKKHIKRDSTTRVC